MRKESIILWCFCLSLGFYQVGFAQEQKTDSVLVSEFIAKKRAFNKEYGYGYRIQLYNGFEVKAKQTKYRFAIEFPTIKTYLTYRKPEWIVQVGYYNTKLEADRALLELVKKFPSCIVVPLGK